MVLVERRGKLETWKPILIKEFEGLYEVSNHGNVRSLDRVFIRSSGRKQSVKGKVLKKRMDADGYYKVFLSNKGKEKNVFVHRLVALSFIDNPHNKPQVNHKNSIRSDNRVENLEWVTAKENSDHCHQQGNGLSGVNHANSKQLALYLDDKIISTYESVKKCSEVMNISPKDLRRYISETKLLFHKLTLDYIDIEDDTAITNHYPFERKLSKLNCKPIKIYDSNKELLGIYENRIIAENTNKFSKETLMYPLKKNTLYLNKYYISYATQYEYLTIDEIYVNKII